MRLAPRLAVTAALLCGSSTAHAVERQHHLALAPNLAMLKVAESPLRVGGGLSAHYTYGLNDQLNLMVEAGHAFVGSGSPVDAPATRPGWVSNVGAGLAYVLDVLRWVPYAGVLASGSLLGGGTTEQPVLAAGAQLAVGMDYQFNRHLVAGVGARQHLLLSHFSTYPSYTTVFAKLEWQWGY